MAVAAALAAEALGREVRVHDHSIGGVGPNELLEAIHGTVADEVAEAEIIVFIVSPSRRSLPSDGRRASRRLEPASVGTRL